MAAGLLLPSQFIIDRLGTRDVRLAHLLMKSVQIIKDQAAIDFHFDMTFYELAALRFTAQMLGKAAAIALRDGPDAFRRSDVDALLVDQVSPAGVTVAEALQLPCAMVCNALALHLEAATPPATGSGEAQPAKSAE